MNSWALVYEGYDPEQEKLREALCTVGNGYFCTRGAAPESSANKHHYPGTYLAGGYNRLETDIAGRTRRQVVLRDGKVVGDRATVPTPPPPA